MWQRGKKIIPMEINGVIMEYERLSKNIVWVIVRQVMKCLRPYTIIIVFTIITTVELTKFWIAITQRIALIKLFKDSRWIIKNKQSDDIIKFINEVATRQ